MMLNVSCLIITKSLTVVITNYNYMKTVPDTSLPTCISMFNLSQSSSSSPHKLSYDVRMAVLYYYYH